MDRATLKSIRVVYLTVQFYRYLTFQPRLAIAGFRDRRRRRNPPNLPVPPARLRFRVHGDLDVNTFVRVGKNITENLHKLLASVDRSLYSFQRVLDFGCGSARVLRNLSDAPASCQLFGTDIDSELVGWCRENVPWATFTTNAPLPPTPLPGEPFDLIYSISVFTHLNEHFQHEWLAELSRIASPGAILILSVHGEHVYQTLPPSEQDRLQPHGFLFLTGTTGWLKLDGLPDFYQTAYHAREYIDREWTQYFEVLDYVPRAINDHQDAVILRKR